MTANMDYYQLCWRRDPSYSEEDAVREYLLNNPKVARDIVYQMDRDDMPFDYETLKEILGSMDPIDTFNLGMMSADRCSLSDDYFRLDGYGNVESISEEEFDDWCINLCSWASSDIVDGKYEIPEELSRVIAIWDVCPEDLGLSYYDNRKPKSNGTASSKPRSRSSKPSKSSKPAKKVTGKTASKGKCRR